VKLDKDLRQAAAEQFFVFPGISHFVAGSEIRKPFLYYGLILGQPHSLLKFLDRSLAQESI